MNEGSGVPKRKAVDVFENAQNASTSNNADSLQTGSPSSTPSPSPSNSSNGVEKKFAYCDPKIFKETYAIRYSKEQVSSDEQCSDYAVLQKIICTAEGKLISEPESAAEKCVALPPQLGGETGGTGTAALNSPVTSPTPDCGSLPEGATETRKMYRETTVPDLSLCVSEEQSRTCVKGTLSKWSGTFVHASCGVDLKLAGEPNCDGKAVGTTETETGFNSATVPFGSNCTQTSRSRKCELGGWTNWSGPALFAMCQPGGAAACQNTAGSVVAHGANESRTMFQSPSVPFGQSCASEIQQRTCFNGTWGAWTGSFSNASCAPAQAATCRTASGSVVAHGSNESRTMFQSSSVPFGQTCASEIQQRTCFNGTWGAWTGSFSNASCVVTAKPPAWVSVTEYVKTSMNGCYGVSLSAGAPISFYNKVSSGMVVKSGTSSNCDLNPTMQSHQAYSYYTQNPQQICSSQGYKNATHLCRCPSCLPSGGSILSNSLTAGGHVAIACVYGTNVHNAPTHIWCE